MITLVTSWRSSFVVPSGTDYAASVEVSFSPLPLASLDVSFASSFTFECPLGGTVLGDVSIPATLVAYRSHTFALAFAFVSFISISCRPLPPFTFMLIVSIVIAVLVIVLVTVGSADVHGGIMFGIGVEFYSWPSLHT